MTVSPNWPQDGNRPPSHVAGGVDSDDSHRPPALPPTLFRLPNLNPVAKVRQPPEPTETQTGLPGNTQPASQATETPAAPAESPAGTPPPSGVPVTPSVAPEQALPRESSDLDDRRRSPNPPAAAAAPPARRRVQESDLPAGRSWMESIGSHGVVVVLLLVVVAAALITGRKSGQQGSDPTLAAHSDLLNFDEGEEVTLPIPVHDSQPAADLAVSAEDEILTQNEDPTVSSLQSSDASGSLVVATDPPASTHEASDPVNAAVHSAVEATAGLDATQTYRDATETGGAGQQGRIEANRVQVNEFVSSNPSLDVLAASTRLAAENTSPPLPSLQDLADEQATAALPPTSQSSGTKPRVSRMPVGMKNLLQYLPDPANGLNLNGATAEAEHPITSE